MSAEENKAVVRHMLDETWDGNLDILNEHPGMRETIPFIKMLNESIAEGHNQIVQQLADGDWVITRFLSSATLAKEFMGNPAGVLVKMETIMLHKVQNGKIVEQHSQGGRVG